MTHTETDTAIKIIVPKLSIWSIIKFEFESSTENRRVTSDTAGPLGAVALPVDGLDGNDYTARGHR